MRAIAKLINLIFLLACIALTVQAQDKPQLVVEKGNDDTINSVHYSPNGKFLITTCRSEGTIKIWETASGRLINTITADAYDAWYTDNGQYIQVEDENKYTLYKADLRTVISQFFKDTLRFAQVSFANRDLWRIEPRNDTAILVENKTGLIKRKIPAHHGEVILAKLFADDKKLLVLSADSTVSIIDLRDDSTYYEQIFPGLMPANALVNEKGHYLVIPLYGKNKKFPYQDQLEKTVVLETDSGRQILSPYNAIALSPDDSTLVIRKDFHNTSQTLVHLPDCTDIDSIQGSVQYSKDGKQIYVDWNDSIITLDSKTGNKISSVRTSQNYVLQALQKKKHYELIKQHPLYNEGKIINSFGPLPLTNWNQLSASAISPDGTGKAIGLYDGTVAELEESSSLPDSILNKNDSSFLEDARFTPALPEYELNRILHNEGLTLFTDPFSPIIDAEYVPRHPYIFTKTWDNQGVIWNNGNASVQYKTDLNYFGDIYTDINQYLGIPLGSPAQAAPSVFNSDGNFFKLFNPTGQTIWKTDSLNKMLPVKDLQSLGDAGMMFQTYTISPDGGLLCSSDRTEDDPSREVNIYKVNGKTSALQKIHMLHWDDFFPNTGDFSGTAVDVKFIGDAHHLVLRFGGQPNKAPFAVKLKTFTDGITILGINPVIPEDNNIDDSMHVSFSRTLHNYVVSTTNKIYRVSATTGQIVKARPVQLEQPQIVKNFDFDPDTKFAFYKEGTDQKIYAIDISTGKQLYSLDSTVNENSTLSFSPDHTRFATLNKEEGQVSVWETATGNYVGGFLGHTKRLLNAVYSQDGKYILCCAQDGSYEKRNAITRELIYTFFLFRDFDFAVVLPQGYYYSSSKSDVKYLNFRQNNELYNFSQFDLQYNRIDKVLEALGSADTVLINAYHELWLKRIKESGFSESDFETDSFHVPRVLLYNAIPSVTKYNDMVPFFSLSDNRYKITSYNIFINDVPIYGMKGKVLQTPVSSYRPSEKILLDSGINKIEIQCTNEKGVSSLKETVYTTYQPQSPVSSKTWFIGVGINHYSQHGYLPNLQYCVKDISDLAAAFKSKYGNIEIDTLMNEDATRQNILNLKKIVMQTGTEDRVIISFNGHGMNYNNEFYFATPTTNPQSPEDDGISYTDMQNLLDSIPARKKLLLIDACHSGEDDADDVTGGIVTNGLTYTVNTTKGNAAQGNGSVQIIDVKTDSTKEPVFNLHDMMKSAFVDLRKNNGAVVIAASQSNQQAHETRDFQNGLFTHCVLNQMNIPSLNVSKLLIKVNEDMKMQTQQQQSESRQELSESDWALW